MQIDLGQFYFSLIVIGIIILLGFFLGKTKKINENTNKQLVNLLLSVFMPASLFNAFPYGMSEESYEMFVKGLIGGFIIMFAVIFVGKIIFHNKKVFKKELSDEAQFAFAFNNATFLGYPLIAAAFGGDVLIAYCGFIIAFNLALFSYGVWLFQHKISWKFIINTIINPNVIAVVLGMILSLSNLREDVPSVINQSINYIAAATTPLSLICIGYMLSTAKLKLVLKKWQLFIVALVQLTIAPLVTWGVLTVINLFIPTAFPVEVIVVCTLIQALPTATSLGLFAEKYGGDVGESSELVVISTLMSVVTLPIATMLLSNMI